MCVDAFSPFTKSIGFDRHCVCGNSTLNPFLKNNKNYKYLSGKSKETDFMCHKHFYVNMSCFRLHQIISRVGHFRQKQSLNHFKLF